MNVDSASDSHNPTTSTVSYGPVLALAWAVRALPLVIVGVVVAALLPIPWWVGLLVGLVAAAVWVWALWRSAAGKLLTALGAQPADADTHARLLNLVRGLSLAGGAGEPDVFVIDSGARNAAAVASGDTKALVATRGLLDAVDRVGLEGVVAESLVRIDNGDAEAATVGAALFGSMLSGPGGAMLSPVAGYGMSRLLGADRDLLADQGAVALTRYPPGLLTALDAVRAGRASVDEVPSSLDHVWFVPPRSVTASAGADDASLDLRIDVLGEL
ncbi:MAG: hypothetical protein AAF962_24320 [Actinomycetota bacterium]